MLSILLDPATFQVEGELQAEARRFVDFVKSSEKVSPDSEILMPGDIERRNRAERTAMGIELDDKTWSQIEGVAAAVKVPGELLERAKGK